MGGHGGLNILPQKSWNVYNYDNREKVRKDEEAAARDEQLKREQSRRRDAEFRIDLLRKARGIHHHHHSTTVSSSSADAAAEPPSALPLRSNHINLFDGLPDFSSLADGGKQRDKELDVRRFAKEENTNKSSKKRRREEGSAPVTVGPEEEKYKLGYGLAGKGVKVPWYLSKPSVSFDKGADADEPSSSSAGLAKRNGGRKSIEELREERMKREKNENEREWAVISSSKRIKGVYSRFSR